MPFAFEYRAGRGHLGEYRCGVFSAFYAASGNLFPSHFEFACAARFERRSAQQINLEGAGRDGLGIESGEDAQGIGAGGSQRGFLDRNRRSARQPAFRFDTSGKIGDEAFRQAAVNYAGAKRAFDGGAGKIRAAGAGAEGGDEQVLGVRPLPILRGARMFKRDAAAGVVLREAAPGSEIQLVGFLELREITFQARTFGQEPEDAPLVENIDVVLPDHVIDRREPLAVADQSGGQARQPIVHAATRQGMGMVTANPARYTGCGKPSGATLLAAPRSSLDASSTEPSVIIVVGCLVWPQCALLSMRPLRTTVA